MSFRRENIPIPLSLIPPPSSKRLPALEIQYEPTTSINAPRILHGRRRYPAESEITPNQTQVDPPKTSSTSSADQAASAPANETVNASLAELADAPTAQNIRAHLVQAVSALAVQTVSTHPAQPSSVPTTHTVSTHLVPLGSSADIQTTTAPRAQPIRAPSTIARPTHHHFIARTPGYIKPPPGIANRLSRNHTAVPLGAITNFHREKIRPWEHPVDHILYMSEEDVDALQDKVDAQPRWEYHEANRNSQMAYLTNRQQEASAAEAEDNDKTPTQLTFGSQPVGTNNNNDNDAAEYQTLLVELREAMEGMSVLQSDRQLNDVSAFLEQGYSTRAVLQYLRECPRDGPPSKVAELKMPQAVPALANDKSACAAVDSLEDAAAKLVVSSPKLNPAVPAFVPGNTVAPGSVPSRIAEVQMPTKMHVSTEPGVRPFNQGPSARSGDPFSSRTPFQAPTKLHNASNGSIPSFSQPPSSYEGSSFTNATSVQGHPKHQGISNQTTATFHHVPNARSVSESARFGPVQQNSKFDDPTSWKPPVFHPDVLNARSPHFSSYSAVQAEWQQRQASELAAASFNTRPVKHPGSMFANVAPVQGRSKLADPSSSSTPPFNPGTMPSDIRNFQHQGPIQGPVDYVPDTNWSGPQIPAGLLATTRSNYPELAAAQDAARIRDRSIPNGADFPFGAISPSSTRNDHPVLPKAMPKWRPSGGSFSDYILAMRGSAGNKASHTSNHTGSKANNSRSSEPNSPQYRPINQLLIGSVPDIDLAPPSVSSAALVQPVHPVQPVHHFQQQEHQQHMYGAPVGSGQLQINQQAAWEYEQEMNFQGYYAYQAQQAAEREMREAQLVKNARADRYAKDMDRWLDMGDDEFAYWEGM